MIPILEKSGKRIIAPDLIGFGKSDKIKEKEEYTYERHVVWTSEIISQLGLKNISDFLDLCDNPHNKIKTIHLAGTNGKGSTASILAKTYRDDYMNKIHEEFPMYNWKKNKGYPTKEHRKAIKTYGITKYHRKSFKLLPEQLKLDF